MPKHLQNSIRLQHVFIFCYWIHTLFYWMEKTANKL